ncbi:MAG: 2,4-dihydroxyhept-2-ene-1,7-dioic acid aldolase [Alphaproteobacteria bacterium]|nr:2,4-dihydroxyhept-2-ene-1,7-dioic acid aldolase [Alphaproteobacteria bacterium]
MRTNRIRELWAAGKPVVNAWLQIPSGFSAEVMAHMGWDAVTVDMQHGVVDYQAAVQMFTAISTTAAVPMARVPWNDPAIIMKVLDGGAYGLICPLVNDRAEAERFVGACRYPPEGYRSSGPIRAALYGGPDYIQHANTTIVTMAMIETREAIANLDAITATPGLDGIYIGPSDLSMTHGGSPGLDQTDPRIVALIEKALAAAKRNGIKAGIQTNNVTYAKRMVALGFDLVTIFSDTRLMVAAGARMFQEWREEAAAAAKPGSVY